MPENPATSDSERPPAADASAPGGRNVAIAILAMVCGLGAVGMFLIGLTDPALAPVLGPLAILAAACALWVATDSERRRLACVCERLTGENAAMAESLEATGRELRESQERYRSLIDARKETEQALLESRRRAEAANQAKSGFLAAVSHEFRTPLNGILGLTGLLLESNLTPDQRTYGQAVHSSGEALLNLVDDMLDFSRIEAGRLDLRPAPTDIAAMLQDIGELLAGRAHGKSIDLAIDIGIGLPASVMVDAHRLRQVLINLVGNAVKFTESGGVTLKASTQSGAGSGRERIAFAVEDSGPGIDPDQVERVFDEFEQIDTAPSRRHGGTGLGLAISRRIVRGMSSDIKHSARSGGGTIFSFVLDLPVEASASRFDNRSLAGRSIMILAPGGPEAPVLARDLAMSGADVRLARNLVEAAALVGAASAADLAYDAVLVDQRISPEPSAVLTRLRQAAGRRVAAVVLIEPGRRGAIKALNDAGFDAYLVRPVRRKSALRIVSDVIAAQGGFRADPEDMRPVSRKPAVAENPVDILLAEDNAINALLVRSILEGLGHRVTEVRDGTAAIAAFVKGDRVFAAILMDLHMPGLDGIAAAAAIREFEERQGRQRAVILALTADVSAATRAQAVKAGIDAVLEKPIAPEKLRQILAEMTDQPAASSTG